MKNEQKIIQNFIGEINGIKIPANTGSITIVLVCTDSGWAAY